MKLVINTVDSLIFARFLLREFREVPQNCKNISLQI